jgi:hypothetical protein
MARYSATWSTITNAAVADGVTFTAGQAMGFLRCGTSTQMLRINEVYIGGESSASTPTTAILARDSTISVGALSVGGNAVMDFNTTAPATTASWGSTAATTFPQRGTAANGLYLLQPSINTFGGIARWQARYGEEITCFGNTANGGEVSLSSKTGAGISSGHIIYEVV